jgi:hypothetical protein
MPGFSQGEQAPPPRAQAQTAAGRLRRVAGNAEAAGAVSLSVPGVDRFRRRHRAAPRTRSPWRCASQKALARLVLPMSALPPTATSLPRPCSAAARASPRRSRCSSRSRSAPDTPPSVAPWTSLPPGSYARKPGQMPGAGWPHQFRRSVTSNTSSHSRREVFVSVLTR